MSAAVEYAKTLVGIAYRWWDPEISCCENTGPFWAAGGKAVPVEEIRRGQLNCAGLLNVICRWAGKPIPGSVEKHKWAGGTGLWWEFFESFAGTCPYVEGNVYPPGTILIRQFREPKEDEGHIAIVYDAENIIHCWPEKGVVIEPAATDFYEAAVVGFL